MARKLKAVTVYLGDEMAQAWSDVVLPRYGLSASAVLEQLIAREVRRIESKETKEQALADIKAAEVILAARLERMSSKLDLLLYMLANASLGSGSFTLTKDEVRKLKEAVRELENWGDEISSDD